MESWKRGKVRDGQRIWAGDEEEEEREELCYYGCKRDLLRCSSVKDGTFFPTFNATWIQLNFVGPYPYLSMKERGVNKFTEINELIWTKVTRNSFVILFHSSFFPSDQTYS
jgi:hypothetical protein